MIPTGPPITGRPAGWGWNDGYERDPRQRHRLLIAERVQVMADLEVRDLFP